jgi:uncharacterized protein YdhG (YjbR/CyaY superfamily)
MATEKLSAETGKADVAAYLARVPEPARATLEKMRAMIRAAAPKEATEAISYKIPSFQYKGALVWYAAFKKHCSFFPMDHSLAEEFAERAEELQGAEGDDSVSGGQAAVEGAGDEDCEGACGGE